MAHWRRLSQRSRGWPAARVAIRKREERGVGSLSAARGRQTICAQARADARRGQVIRPVVVQARRRQGAGVRDKRCSSRRHARGAALCPWIPHARQRLRQVVLPVWARTQARSARQRKTASPDARTRAEGIEMKARRSYPPKSTPVPIGSRATFQTKRSIRFRHTRAIARALHGR